MSIHTLALQQLLALHVVLEERNVARAARRLHVTPSAVSNALAKLRDELSDPLLVRSGRGVVPTPRAEQLAPALSHAFASLEHALRPPTFDKRSMTRTLVMAVADSGQLSRVPALVARMAAEMPRARLKVVGIDAVASLGGLAGGVDVALGPSERGPGVHSELLCVEHAVLVARTRHRAARKPLSREELGRLEHVAVAVAAGANLPDLTSRAYEAAGVPRSIAVTVPTFAAAAMIASTTDFVATLPEGVYAALATSFGLLQLRGPLPKVEVSVRMAWHSRSHSHPELSAFRALVAEAWRAPSRRRRGARPSPRPNR
ncbi:MAG: LysR family transcriptional regulator [Labilithrix sp.]|nr:LysR family transcriptional regulator [Labilithrix sp.]